MDLNKAREGISMFLEATGIAAEDVRIELYKRDFNAIADQLSNEAPLKNFVGIEIAGVILGKDY